MDVFDPRVQALPLQRQETLQTYIAVTGQDIGEAIALLSRSEWNTQIAVTKFFDGEDTSLPQASPELEPQPDLQPHIRRETLFPDNDDDDLAAFGVQGGLVGARSSSRSSAGSIISRPEPAPRIATRPVDPPTARPGFLLGLFFTGYNLLYRIASGGIGLLGVLFPFIPRLLQGIGLISASRRAGGLSAVAAGAGTRGGGDGSSGQRKTLSPKDTAARFIREFEESYGIATSVSNDDDTSEEGKTDASSAEKPTTLPFLENGYNMSLEKAHQESKFLLVLLLSSEHEHTDPWVRNSLLSPGFLSFLAENRDKLLLWGGNVRDSEPYTVSTSLKVTKFPFMGVVVHTPNVSSTAMSLAARIPGLSTPGEIVQKISTAIETFNPALERVRAQRTEQRAARSIREEQDLAYQRSLERDRERARQKKEEEERAKREEERKREEEERARNYEANLKAWKRWRAHKLLEEPEESDKSAVRINFVLLDKDRCVRRFKGDMDIEEVYAFVECLDEIDEEGETVEEPPEGFEHKYGFRLVMPMPRTEIPLENGGTIRERIGRGGTLVVERVDGEEAEEDDEDEEEE
ncbi:hypothetical protein KEM56_007885 [Ascosphaera pollenicola]|nr:hypothetical protein KEM56_007885 [Ascosphaera pollenicola]